MIEIRDRRSLVVRNQGASLQRFKSEFLVQRFVDKSVTRSYPVRRMNRT